MKRFISAGLIAIAATLSACGSSPPTRYYALNVVPPGGSIHNPSDATVIRLDPVTIPAELDRLELVLHSDPNRVRIDDTQRWVAPLDQQLRRTLSDDLSARLPAGLVADPYEPATAEPRRLLSLNIAQFQVDERCAVTLQAHWTLRGSSAAASHGDELIQLPPSGACTDGLAAAMSRALAELAEHLTAMLVALPGASSH